MRPLAVGYWLARKVRDGTLRWDTASSARDDLRPRTRGFGEGRGYSLVLGGDKGGDGGDGEERELHGRLIEMGEVGKEEGDGGCL